MKKKHKTIIRVCSWFLFVVYVVCMVYFLFFSEQFGRIPSEESRANLEPLKEIKRFIKYSEQLGGISFFINLFGNVLCFMPFGFVIPILSVRQRRLWKVTLLSFLCSLVVEVTQYVTKLGVFDVDDLLLNTIGGFLGYVLFAICLGIMHILFPYKKNNTEGKS